MDLEGTKMQEGPRWAWARTGALVLFLVAGVLLLASLGVAKSQHAPDHAPGVSQAESG
jgi:hypothetical protein